MIDIKLKIYEKLIKAKDFQDVNYYLKILRGIVADLERLHKGRYEKGRSKGQSYEQLKQNSFEKDIEIVDPQILYEGEQKEPEEP